MALLMRHPRLRDVSTLVLGIAFVTLAGCVLFDGARSTRRSYAFSHKVHVEQELACTDCHLAAESADDPGMPGVGACKLCHGEIDAQKPADRKVETLFEGKKYRTLGRTNVGPEIVFPHLRHVAAGLECAACHAEVAGNEDAIELAPARMDNCTQCHAERKVANDCATCHPTILPGLKPESHGGTWTRQHGNVCRAGTSDRTSDRCDLCHKETDCASCHQTNPPENHTNQWRRVGHGVTAALDRESCSTCHQPSACLSCHEESTPRSHNSASFGAPRSTHCITCHEPLQGEGCSACHASTPSHALASPKPPSHTPSMNCRQCHQPGGVLPPMPHVDDGSNCNRCHH